MGMKKTVGTKLLRLFKAKYNLTWPEVAKSLGISVSRVQDMYSGDYKVPHYYVFMLRTYMRLPGVFEIYKEFKHKDL